MKPNNLFPFEHMGHHEGCYYFQQYANNGSPAVELLAWDTEGEYLERWAMVSVNVDESAHLGPDEFVAKEYSENTALVQQLIDAGHFLDTGRSVKVSGYVGLARILKITPLAKTLVQE